MKSGGFSKIYRGSYQLDGPIVETRSPFSWDENTNKILHYTSLSTHTCSWVILRIISHELTLHFMLQFQPNSVERPLLCWVMLGKWQQLMGSISKISLFKRPWPTERPPTSIQLSDTGRCKMYLSLEHGKAVNVGKIRSMLLQLSHPSRQITTVWGQPYNEH